VSGAARLPRTLATLLVVTAAAFALTGCGTGGLATGSGDTQSGSQLFTAKCGGCHTLAAAGTQGKIGPDLDAAFAADRKQGIADSTITNVVLDQMRLPNPPMPGPDQLFPVCKDGTKNVPVGCVPNQSQALEDVAAYVTSVAGVNGAEPKSTATKSTDGKTIFTTTCGSCHTLAAAGTSGKIGPNLDQLKPAFAVAKRQVENGGGVMPAFKGRLTPQQIDAVAKYVSDNAGK
jgi:mono/diheme cytochrome c family protein